MNNMMQIIYRIRYFISKKTGITDIISHNFFTSFVNKNENNYNYNIFVGEDLYESNSNTQYF